MKHSTLCFLMASCIVVHRPTSAPCEAANPVATSVAGVEVRKILLEEIKGEADSVDRRTALQPATHIESASNTSWWQSGYVKLGNTWKRVEQSNHDANLQLLDEYQAQRAAAPMSVDGQQKLANWCENHNLKDQERAHLMRVLALSDSTANVAPIYKRMGYRQLGNQWFSPLDLQAMRNEAQKFEELRRRHGPTIERIARNWNANAKTRKQSQRELDAIVDVAVLCGAFAVMPDDEPWTRAICQCLDRLTTFESSQALATIAIQSENPEVRQVATESLKGRRIDDFAPMLLDAIHSPLSVTTRSTDLSSERIILREEKDRFIAVDLRIVPERCVLDPTMIVHMRRGFISYPARIPVNTRVTNDAARTIDDIDFMLQHRIDHENDRTEVYNHRAASILAEITGQDPSTNPWFWWAWWHLYTATQPLPKKCEVIVKNVVLPATAIKRVGVVYSPSCLIAGTPIWTERGFVPVEKIQIGDRVLAKDVESGELDYKPILQTTDRQPVPVRKFVVGGSPIVASDGHHFWSSGSGWTKTRDIKPNLPIHTVTGMSRVQSMESVAEPAPVYNLVVADFHTYFVGPSMILSHDVSPPAPTNAKVPGLVESVQ